LQKLGNLSKAREEIQKSGKVGRENWTGVSKNCVRREKYIARNMTFASQEWFPVGAKCPLIYRVSASELVSQPSKIRECAARRERIAFLAKWLQPPFTWIAAESSTNSHARFSRSTDLPLALLLPRNHVFGTSASIETTAPGARISGRFYLRVLLGAKNLDR